MKELIRDLVTQALAKAREQGDIKSPALPEIVIEEPRDASLGDFSTTVAMSLAKTEKQPPKALAEAICRQLGRVNGCIESAQAAGPGFINIKMTDGFYHGLFRKAAQLGDGFGRSNIGSGVKVNVEFVSANPTGPLHVGHGRGAAVGDTMGSILRFAGFDVTKEYYVNDVGNQMNFLGNSTWLRYQELHGRAVDFPKDHYQGGYIKDIAREIQQKHGGAWLEKPEKERTAFFRKYANDSILEGIKKDLADFRARHDLWFSEQSLYEDGQVEQGLAWLREKDFIYEKEGAVWLKSSAFQDEKDRVIIRNTGEKTYFCSDIAYHRNKISRGFKKIVNIWGADHHGYVPRMKAVLEAMGYNDETFQVTLVQFVTLRRGGEKVSMSTRSGEFVTLAEVVGEVGVDAARFFFLMRSADSHLDFDLELAKKESPENPVYYIQYAHARICSVFQTAAEQGVGMSAAAEVDLAALGGEDLALMKKILRFPEVMEKSAQTLEIHKLPFYLQELAALFHGYYNRNRIVSDDRKLTLARLFLLHCLRGVIKNGLALMGVSAPEKM